MRDTLTHTHTHTLRIVCMRSFPMENSLSNASLSLSPFVAIPILCSSLRPFARFRLDFFLASPFCNPHAFAYIPLRLIYLYTVRRHTRAEEDRQRRIRLWLTPPVPTQDVSLVSLSSVSSVSLSITPPSSLPHKPTTVSPARRCIPPLHARRLQLAGAGQGDHLLSGADLGR